VNKIRGSGKNEEKSIASMYGINLGGPSSTPAVK